jgi:hypothetical protein
MLDFIEPKHKTFISFGELLEVLCVFCRFSHRQLVHFIFLYLDERKEHFLPLDLLKHYVQKSHQDGGSFQINHAFRVLEGRVKAGLVGADELLAFDHQFPYMFYPSSKVQTAMISKSFGERFWDIKRDLIVDENAIAALRQPVDDEDDDLFGEGAVKRRMGSWYWWTPWRREYNRTRLRRMAIIDAELDAMVDAAWAVTHPSWVRSLPYTDDEGDERDSGEEEDEEDPHARLADQSQLPLPSMLDSDSTADPHSDVAEMAEDRKRAARVAAKKLIMEGLERDSGEESDFGADEEDRVFDPDGDLVEGPPVMLNAHGGSSRSANVTNQHGDVDDDDSL